MRQVSTPRPTHLLCRQAFRLQARRGQRIECESGQLWITQDGDPRDVILRAHECFTLDRGLTLVSALEDASFVLSNPGAVQTSAANCAY